MFLYCPPIYLRLHYFFRKLLHGILAEKTPVITTQSKKELEEEILLVKEAMEFVDVLENPEENAEDEVAEDGEGEEQEEE